MFLKTIKLFRKAFFTNFLKIHYSQFGEDIVLREILKNDVRDGYYVDVGCFHPKKLSNTYMLYKKGWRGINIDMEEDKIRLFNMVRPHDTNIMCPISDKTEIVTIYRFGKYGTGSSIDKDFAAKSTSKIHDTQNNVAKTLNEIINETSYKDTHIDVLSIDVEGMDFRVINSLDIKKYQPKIIIIESHHNKIDDVLNSKTFKLLSGHGYILRSWTFYSLIFILPGADILKDREYS